MGTNQNKEILEKLQHLNDLLEENFKLNDYIENDCVKETAQKVKAIKSEVGTLPAVPSVFSNMPIFPLDAESCEKVNEQLQSNKRLFTIIGIATAVCLLLYFITHIGFLNTVGAIGVIATIVTGLMYRSSRKDVKEKTKAYEDSVALYNKTMADFKASLSRYESEAAKGIAAAKEYEKRYAESYSRYLQELDAYAENKTKAMDTFVANFEEIQANDLIPEEYYHHIPKLVTLLKSGRADDLKEALNLAIAEEREAKAQAARLAEEARRTQMLEQQAAEERRHNMQMEQQAAMQSQMMADQVRQQQKQERQERQKAMSRCIKCANYSACLRYTDTTGVPNCASFVPKR